MRIISFLTAILLLPMVAAAQYVAPANNASDLTLTGTQSLENKTINGVTLSGSGTLTVTGTGGAVAYKESPTAITATANVKFGASAGAGITHVLPATPAAGDRAKYYVTASGGDRTLDFDAAIKVPSDSALSLPKTMTSGKTYIVQLEYLGSSWALTTLVGGY